MKIKGLDIFKLTDPEQRLLFHKVETYVDLV